VQTAVSGLDQEFEGKVIASNVEATTDNATAVVESLGWKNHGIVIRSGGGDVLFNQPDHEVDIEVVRGELTKLLGEGH
jgi:hypothetical protein